MITIFLKTITPKNGAVLELDQYAEWAWKHKIAFSDFIFRVGRSGIARIFISTHDAYYIDWPGAAEHRMTYRSKYTNELATLCP